MKTFDELVKEANAKGWRVLNMYQFQDYWRCNLQKRTPHGATEAVFSEYSDGKTAIEALAAVVKHCDSSKRPPFITQRDDSALQLPQGRARAAPAPAPAPTPQPRARAVPAPSEQPTTAPSRKRAVPADAPAPAGNQKGFFY